MALTAPLGVQVIRGHKETDSRFVLCLWFVHDMFMVYGLFTVCSTGVIVYGLCMVCSRFVPVKYCSRFVRCGV
jgi:hypothetical protein